MAGADSRSPQNGPHGPCHRQAAQGQLSEYRLELVADLCSLQELQAVLGMEVIFVGVGPFIGPPPIISRDRLEAWTE